MHFRRYGVDGSYPLTCTIGKEHKSHADRLRTVSLEFAGTEMEHMPISAPEKVGFQEAIAVRDVGFAHKQKPQVEA